MEALHQRVTSCSSSAIAPSFWSTAFVVAERAVSAKGSRGSAEPAARIRSEAIPEPP
jgi:hypothetical protein